LMTSSFVGLQFSLLRLQSSFLRLQSSLLRLQSSLLRLQSSLLRLQPCLLRLQSSLLRPFLFSSLAIFLCWMSRLRSALASVPHPLVLCIIPARHNRNGSFSPNGLRHRPHRLVLTKRGNIMAANNYPRVFIKLPATSRGVSNKSASEWILRCL
jgi:hypothetical protein